MEGNKLGAMGMPVQGWDLHAGSFTLPRDELRLMSFWRYSDAQLPRSGVRF